MLREADGWCAVSHNSGITLPNLPGGLITRPTLVWDVATKKPGKHATRVAYQTTGITWRAYDNLTYSEGADANSCNVNVGAWVSILNQSGASYPDARIKLIAGDVHRAPAAAAPSTRVMMKAMAEEAKDEAGFQEKTFFEYHLYTLGRPSSLPDNSTSKSNCFRPSPPCRARRRWSTTGNRLSTTASDPTPTPTATLASPATRRWTPISPSKTRRTTEWVPDAVGARASKTDAADGSLEFIGRTASTTPRRMKPSCSSWARVRRGG